MSERGIIFGPDMVNAIREGRKTQTRRIIRCGFVGGPEHRGNGREPELSDPHFWDTGFENPETGEAMALSELGSPFHRAEVAWVRETWAAGPGYDGLRPSDIPEEQYILRWYRADTAHGLPKMRGRWRSSIHMPRWISRIDLRILSVRPERLQQISEADAEAEGITKFYDDPNRVDRRHPKFREGFHTAWDDIHKKRGRGWASDPWVWRIEFVGPVVSPAVERRRDG